MPPLALCRYRPKTALLQQKLEISRLHEARPCVHLRGHWRLQDGLPPDEELDRDVESAAATPELSFDTHDLAGWDSSLVTFLASLIDGCQKRGVQVNRAGLPEGV